MSNNEKRCVICSQALIPMKNYSGLLRCQGCGFITTDLDISEEELKELYGGDFFHGSEYSDYTRDKPVLQRHFRRRLAEIRRCAPPAGNRRLFELGCAYGFFLELAKEEYAAVYGMDISEDAARYAREKLGLDAVAANYLDEELPEDKRFDVCCLWDTIEHVRSPELIIAKISREMNDGGVLALTTGDIGSLNARMRGRKWRQVHPPTHLHYFNPRSMTALMEANGLEVLRISHPGTFMSVDTMCHIMFVIRSKREKLYNFLKKTGLLKLNVYVNLGDLMMVIARKRPS